MRVSVMPRRQATPLVTGRCEALRTQFHGTRLRWTMWQTVLNAKPSLAAEGMRFMAFDNEHHKVVVSR